MNTSTHSQDTTLAGSLLGRRTRLAFAFLLAYGGGLWLHLLHEAEGAVEPGAPPGVIHWLRDSTLALPLVAAAVFLGAALCARLFDRSGARTSDLVAGGVVAVVLAFYASVVLAVGSPLHGLLFPAIHAGGHELPFELHMLRDGLLALSANELLAASLVAALLGRRWLAATRVWPAAPALPPLSP